MQNGYQHVSRELLLTIDMTGTIINISANCYNILGYQREEMIGSNINHYIVEGVLEIHIDESNEFELKLENKQGLKSFYDVVAYPNKDGIKISLINSNKYKEIEEQKIKFENILDNSIDIIYRYEIVPEKKFTYINGAVEKQLGASIDVNYSQPLTPFELTHPEDYEIMMKKILGKLDYSKASQMRLKNAEGQYIWFEDYVIPEYNEKKELIAISGFCRNIQDRKALEMKLEEFSYYDSLTGLFSRNYYQKHEKRLNELEDSSVAIIICDFDNLKTTNDSLGHIYGDKLLINFANMLKRKFEKDTVVARFGGDEFVVLIENISEEGVKNIYVELLEQIKEYNKMNITIPIVVSLGWAYSETSLGTIQNTFDSADSMMYENKFKKRKRPNVT